MTLSNLLVLLMALCIQLKLGESCVDVCQTVDGSWNSMIITNRGARHIFVTWLPDTTPSPRYVVQYRRQNTQRLYSSSEEVSSTEYNITQLTPETEYEVRICRAISTLSADDCGNCLFCTSTVQAPEPPGPPTGVQVRADSSESITVLWKEPEVTNGVISNYSVVCFNNNTRETIINKTVTIVQPQTEFFLEPDTTYICSVIAFNIHGPSLPQRAVGTTLPITTVPSLLLLVYEDGVEYAEITESAIQSRMLTYERLLNTSTDATIRGLDYHFYRGELYMTQEDLSVRRVSARLVESPQLGLTRTSNDVEVLFQRDDSVGLGSITVDWVNDELYWIERLAGGYRIVRAVIQENGSVAGPFCVVSVTGGMATHLIVDPVHGYLYWSDTSAISRVSIHNIRVNTTLDSCPSDIASKVRLINNLQLETFTIEPSEAIYFVGYDPCFDVPANDGQGRTNRSVIGTPLNAAEQRVHTGITSPINTIDSFDRTLFFAVDRFILVVDSSQVAECPTFPPIRDIETGRPVLLLRTYRSVKQPLPVPPGPPTDILVTSTSTQATVTWNAPLFIGEFFSEGAFANWTYVIRWRALNVPSAIEMSMNTSDLTEVLGGLQPESLYEISVLACGPSLIDVDCQMARDKLVFSTKSADSDNLLLLVATESGVFRSRINGSSAAMVGGVLSIESNGVAYDSYTGQVYWSVEGGQGRIYRSNINQSENGSVIFPNFRRNPFSLNFDWVARRLFWIEDGDTVRGPKSIVYGSLEDTSSIVPFDKVDDVHATVLDSFNGLLFLASDANIRAVTLGGLSFEPLCHPTGGFPFGFTVDSERRRLYWLNNDASDGHLIVNQIEYTSTACDPNTIVAEDLTGLSFSSSSTVMAYAADTLFIGSLNTDRIYTVASDLANVGEGQALAVGVVQLDLPSGQQLSYRDMVITSERLQALPGTLQPPDRQKDLLTPSVATPPRLSERSSSSVTIIEWDPSTLLMPISATPVHYLLQYSLPPQPELINVTSETNSVTLVNIPPETTLSASVTAYSLWFPSAPSQTVNFSSPPALPGTVTNIRAYVYRPTRGSSELTALVLWDEPDFVVSNYLVSVFVNNVEQFPQPQVQGLFAPSWVLYQSPSNESHYIISARNFANDLNYFLTAGTTYEIQITAVNPSGSGNPSPRVTLQVTEPNYPQNVLVVNGSGVHLVGADADLNYNLPTSAGPPLAVDTIGRFVYWYHEPSKSIARHSLNSNRMDVYPYLLLPVGEDLLAMAFEWVGMELYFMLRNEDNYLKIMKVSAVNRDLLSPVAPALQETISPTAQVEMTVDPFGGYLHWLVTDDNGTSLHQMNLRNISSSSVVVVASRVRRQTNQIASLNLSSALLLDPRSGNLLLSDLDTGDIVSCNVSSSACNVLVSPGDLAAQPSCGGLGLPATSLALNEQRLYWTGGSSSCIFAVDLDNPTSLLVIPSDSASKVFTLSPGQQPLPTQECLSPNVMSTSSRPESSITNFDNTSVSLLLMAPPLDEGCNDVVISFPPVIFGINIEDGDRSIPGFPISTYSNEYSVTGLRPFTEYEVELSVSNTYTTRRNYIDQLFSSGRRFTTTEGVPDPPTGVNHIAFGTADIQLNWTEPTFDRLKGETPTYYVKLYSSNGTCTGSVQVDRPWVEVNASVGVTQGDSQEVAVIISNFVLNSTETRILVTPWPLVPKPELSNRTNTSIEVNVVLDGSSIFEPVTRVHAQACKAADNNCECIGDLVVRDSRPVNSSSRESFTFDSLESFTWYCVQSVGTYRVDERFKSDPEVTLGESALFMTDQGVPDAPQIGLREDMPNMLEWGRPNSRGDEIQFYRVTAMQDGVHTVPPLNFEIIDRSATVTFNLGEQSDLIAGEKYIVHVIAVNGIGESEPSNEQDFTRVQGSLNFIQIVGISIGSVAFVVIIIIIVLVAFICSCNVWRRKELTSLSYMYGPDHELSNLRDAYRHAHANNPHYTWSRDDYVCTDEEIDLLNKFPRQSLKLETFIDRGEFGEVYQGNAIDILGPDTGPTPVAVKTLRKGTTYEEQRKFLSEASLMSKFNHPNIVKVLGVCVDNDPVYIIMELMPAGDLLKFLRDAKRDHGPTLLTLAEQVQVALDVANGCRYLELQHYIHRDIAARNCLVSSKGADRVVKIGDFGLARDLYSSDYYQVEGQRKLPVRWMAPEALLQGKFAIESDIWSFGVLLWEIMTLGNQPYPGRINQEVLQYVTGGGRLDRPEKCPGRIYHLMQSCWKRYSSERPHFDQIVTILTNFLARVKRPGSGYYSDSDSEDGEANAQPGKLPSRTPSIRSGILNLARTGSMKLRNSFRRHGSIHRRDEHAVSHAEEGGSYRERGPF